MPLHLSSIMKLETLQSLKCTSTLLFELIWLIAIYPIPNNIQGYHEVAWGNNLTILCLPKHWNIVMYDFIYTLIPYKLYIFISVSRYKNLLLFEFDVVFQQEIKDCYDMWWVIACHWKRKCELHFLITSENCDDETWLRSQRSFWKIILPDVLVFVWICSIIFHRHLDSTSGKCNK